MSSQQNSRNTPVSLGIPSGRSPATPADTAFVPPLSRGELLLGKYRIEELIGTGGVGYVMSATNIGLDEQVALKFLRREFLSNDVAVHRFTTEARVAAKIQNLHVTRVLDIESASAVGPFIVMERLVGRDLNQVLHEDGPLPAELAVDYVLQACEALSAAHACDTVHRDVKPDNLFLARQPQGPDVIKILDFGISKLQLPRVRSSRNPTLFQTTTAVGSPSYMAPEQVRATPSIDARADVWSLGCVLYELLTGKHAFDAPTMIQICAVVLEQEPPSLRAIAPDVSPELEAVILRCLEKEPERRYADVAELAKALTPFTRSSQATAERCRLTLTGDAWPRLPPPPNLPLAAESLGLEPEASSYSSLSIAPLSTSPNSTAPLAIDGEERRAGAPTRRVRGGERFRDRLAFGAFAVGVASCCVGVLSLRASSRREAAAAARSTPKDASESFAAPARAPTQPAVTSADDAALRAHELSSAESPSAVDAALQAVDPAPKPDTHSEAEAVPVSTHPRTLKTPSLSEASMPKALDDRRNLAAAFSGSTMPPDNVDAMSTGLEPASMPPAAEPTPVAARSVPTPSTRPSNGKPSFRPSPLSPKAVSAVVRAHSSSIQACFERAGVDYESLKGKVTLVTLLDAEGNVLHASTPMPFDGGARLGRCLVSAASSWKFPARPGATSVISYKLVLE
jgi:serine/threonine protein kinase